MSSTLMSAARLPSTNLNDSLNSLNSLHHSSLPHIHEDEAQEHPLPTADVSDEVSYEEEYVLDEEEDEDEDDEYFVEEEFVEEEDEDEDEDEDGASVFTEITYDSGDGANLLGDSDHNTGLLGGDDEEDDEEASFFDFEDSIHDLRSSTRSRASRASASSRSSQGGGIRRQVRFPNSETRKAEEEVMKHSVQEEEARASRDAALAKQRELEAQLEEVQRAREVEAAEATKRNREMEHMRIMAEQREAEGKAAQAAEAIRQVEADNRRLLEEEEALRRAKEEEGRRISAERAARQQIKEETARRLVAEEALARAVEEKRKMEENIKRIEMELSTARKSKEEAARRHEEESDKLKTKIETKQTKAKQKLEKVTEKKTLDQQARAKVDQLAPEKTPEPEADPASPVVSTKAKITGTTSVAPVTPSASRAESKSIGQPSLPEKQTPSAGASTTPRRVVRRINKATGEVISETSTPGSTSRRRVVKKVVKRTAKAPDVPTTIVADTQPESALVSPMRSSRVWSKPPGTSPAAILSAPSLGDDDEPEQPKLAAPKSKKTPAAAPAAATPPAATTPAPPKPAEAPTAASAPPAGGGSAGGVDSYSLTQLQKMSVPGLEYNQREKYLSVEDFGKVFACIYEDYQKWPKWRQTKAKRAAKLF
jgi:hypothetical protein